VRLTDAGRERIQRELQPGDAGARFAGAREAEEAVERALAALHLYARDQQYVVVDGKVQIVDESTGRAMPDRAWERGLHQTIEVKEVLALTGERETLARITYQRLFRRYLLLSGMSGTATEVAGEIGRTYGLPVVRVPLHKPSRRSEDGVRCEADAASKWLAVADAAQRVACDAGRPVLVGTRTVAASEQLSALLAQRGIEHVVLNAKQDRDEAAIVACAGQAGRVTVATNMAGRGTDIALGDGVVERGGLHVILTEYHESRRIDRQLYGRCARQGDAGSAQAIVALDDELFTAHAPWLVRALVPSVHAGRRRARLALMLLRTVAQWNAEARNRAAREASLKNDRRHARLLAFAGRGE
jgi:preprotein translocase subunit SecA